MNITFCSENPFESKGQEVKKMFIQYDFKQQWVEWCNNYMNKALEMQS